MKIGDRFGRLTVIETKENNYVLCHCDCGNEKTIRKVYLTNGGVKSCGCLRRGQKAIN